MKYFGLYMKKIFFALILLICIPTIAQNSNEILMEVNGKKITVAEFLYSYNKNNSVEGVVEPTSVKDYAQMYVNYKLKVAEAEALGYDTTSTFIAEFRKYRDMQLTPLLVDSVFIENRAKDYYANMLAQLNGKALLSCSHILLRVASKASDAELKQASLKADSIYQLLLNGADFSELAKQYSMDPGSASKGGKLPWIGPGSTLKEFEAAAYSLKVGEISQPTLSPVGYHIIRLEETKNLDSYQVLRPIILNYLKQQGIEEASAEAQINQKISASKHTLDREQVLKDLLEEKAAKNPELQYLINEYYDGLLLYDVAKNNVWDVAANDTIALERFYNENKKNYKWEQPRFSGFVIHANNKADLKRAKKLLKKHQNGDWRKMVRKEINKDSIVCVVQGPYFCTSGVNKFIDYKVFKSKDKEPKNKYQFFDVVGTKLKQPKTLKHVSKEVVADYTKLLEDQWVAELRKKYTFKIYEDVLHKLQ